MKSNMLFAVTAVLLLSCNTSSNEEMLAATKVNDQELSNLKPEENKGKAGLYKMADNTTDTATAPSQVFQSGQPAANPDWDKKIIKTAHVTLELKDYTNYNNAIHAKLKSYGAYVAQEQQNQTDEQISNDISIKVPVDKFDDLMNSLSGDGIKVLEKNISTEDVTGEVVDTKARMEAKKQVRDRYLDLSKGEVDVAFRSGDTDDELVGRKIADSFWAVYASRGYVERYGKPEHIEDLSHHLLVGFDEGLSSHRAAKW
ncbi:MAG: DUF4349 domain-containing protein, partial [Panacibacter sp.]